MDAIAWLTPFVFILAGTVKGAIGIGLPTTVIAILSQFADPRLAVALGLIPILFSNFWQSWREGEQIATFRRYLPYALALVVSLYIFSDIAAGFEADTVTLFTGIGIGIFAALNLWKQPPPIPARWLLPAQVAFGCASGLMGGLTGLWAPPLVIMLIAIKADKTEFIRATSLLLFLGALPMTAGYAMNGLMTMEVALWSLAMTVPTFLGFTTGARIRRRMADARFQKAVLIFFLLMGLNMIRKALLG